MHLEPTKTGFPYLVDLGITSYCPFNCKFCYANSSAEGTFCDFRYLQKVIRVLKEANVMEVVLGGNGEPTFHPKFYHILTYLKRQGFRTSFTTKNYNIMTSSLIPRIPEKAGSIAMSCNSLEDFKKLNDIYHSLDKYALNKYSYITLQLVLGLHPFEYTKELVKEFVKNDYKNITFLGFKNTGRGKGTTEYPIPEDWLKPFKKNLRTLGVDSVLVSKYRDYLIANKVDPKYLVTKEGINTCYIDATAKTMHRSSFCEEPGTDISEISKDSFIDIFSRYV